jgi:hypothetical protein
MRMLVWLKYHAASLLCDLAVAMVIVLDDGGMLQVWAGAVVAKEFCAFRVLSGVVAE